MKNISKLLCGVIALNGVFFSHSLFAENDEIKDAKIFKCTSKQGAIYYNDKPCPVDDVEKKIRSEKDVVNGYVPTFSKEEQPVARSGVTVGASTTRSIGVLPEKSSDKELKPQSDRSSSGGNLGGASSSSGNQKKTGLIADSNIQDMSPPKAKIVKRSGPDGKLSVQEKRAFLGISPIER